MPWRVGGPGFDFRHIQSYFLFSSFLSFFPFSFSFFSYFPFHCEGCPLPLPLEREIWIISKINARLLFLLLVFFFERGEVRQLSD